MKWWVSLYLVLYLLLTIVGLWDDYRDGRRPWYLGLAILANLVVLYLFVSYWQLTVPYYLGVIAPTAFIAAMFWELFQAIEDILSERRDETLTELENRVLVIVATLVTTAFSLPAFTIAGICAFRHD